jgi:hypothetical protein
MSLLVAPHVTRDSRLRGWCHDTTDRVARLELVLLQQGLLLLDVIRPI